MNDFTKEELEELRASRCYHLDDNFPYEDKLFMKIHFMIEEYCEHECNGIRYAVIKLRSTDERDYEFKCSKCKKVIFQY